VKRMLRTLPFLTLAILLAAITGLASTITDSFSFPTTTTPFTISSSAVPDFNPSMGTLTSIEFVVSGSASGTATISNESAAPGTYIFSIRSTTQLLDPFSSPLLTIAPSLSGTLAVPAGGTATSGVLTSPTVSDSLIISSGLGLYVGTGTYVFTLMAMGLNLGTATGPLPFTISEFSSDAASGEVIYNFSPASATPEPASLFLLGSALSVLGFVIGRRRKRG
jgi:hypothetical protein